MRVPSPVPLVRVVRSGLEESVHVGDVAVCDSDGRLIAAMGDPDRLVFARSSMKPIQASVSFGRIGVDLPDELIAISAASHHAEPRHSADHCQNKRMHPAPVPPYVFMVAQQSGKNL